MTEHPPCLICGDPVQRRGSESPSRWLKRGTCSAACKNKLHAQQMRAFNRYRAPERDAQRKLAEEAEGHAPCLTCGAPIVRRPTEKTPDWRIRKCCSRACSLALTSRIRMEICNSPLLGMTEHSPCILCGGPVLRREGESPARWLRRQLCGRECFRAANLDHLELGKEAAAKARKAQRMIDCATEKHPPCLHCGGPVPIRPQEPRHDWIKRKDCSRKCCDMRRRKPRPERDVGQPARAFIRQRGMPQPSAQFETVEEALARGLTITRIEPPVVAVVGNPVRVRAGWLA